MGLKKVPVHLLLRKTRWNSIRCHHHHNLEYFLINKCIPFFSYFDYNEWIYLGPHFTLRWKHNDSTYSYRSCLRMAGAACVWMGTSKAQHLSGAWGTARALSCTGKHQEETLKNADVFFHILWLTVSLCPNQRSYYKNLIFVKVHLRVVALETVSHVFKKWFNSHNLNIYHSFMEDSH